MSRSRLSRQQRLAQLLECALSASARHGLARVTHSHIAEAADVSVPTAYAYFRTREQLVSAVVNEVETFLTTLVFDTMSASGDTHQRFAHVAHAFSDAARSAPDLLKVWLDWSTGVESPLWPQYLDLLDRLHKAYARAIRRAQKTGSVDPGIDPKIAGQLFAGGGHTLVLMIFAGATNRQVNQFIDQLVDGALGPRRA